MHNGVDFEIAVARSRRTNANSAVRLPRGHAIKIGGGRGENGLDVELAAGAEDTHRNFTAIGDQDAAQGQLTNPLCARA